MSSGAVTVAIVTYNSAGVLSGCLEALGPALRGLDARVIVVDNASTDASIDVAREAPELLVIQMGRNAGFAAAINRAARQCRPGDDLLVLNPDVRLQPGNVAELQRALRASHAGIAVPLLLGPTGELRHSLRRTPTLARALGEAVLGGQRAARWPRWSELVTDPAMYRHEGWTDWATGAVMLISEDCRLAVGDWDEQYFLYSEETDYCLRARQLGFGVRFTPEAAATHIEGRGETSPTLRPVLIRSKLRLYRRGHGRWSRAAFWAVTAVNEGLRVNRPSHRSALGTLLGRRPELSPSPRPVVMFSAQDYWYHNRAHSDVQLARAMSAHTTVLLVNSIGMRMPTPGRSTQVVRRVLRKVRSTSRGLRRPEQTHPDMAVLSPIILPAYGSPLARRLNAVVVRAQVRMALRALGTFGPPDVVVTIPTALDVVRGLRHHSLVINRSDKYSAFPETDQALMQQLEADLLGQADAAVYVSRQLLEQERPLVHGRSVFLGHGVDFAAFAGARADEPPNDLATIATPRIGFFGGIDDYVIDLDLLARLARELPDAQLVLIGDATCSMDALTAFPNVHWLGRRPYEQIPAYGAGFDVGIMPWLRNDWVQHCNPIKAMEYLALGLPSVTTRYGEAAALEQVMDVADSADEFVSMVAKALGGGKADRERRQRAVREFSWTVRGQQLLDVLAQKGPG